MMKIYNSLSRQIENFQPIHKDKVGMYSCGPTVYNNLHIGNLSAFIYADLLRRTLSSTYEVTAVMNITDVDDKTIRDSQKDYPEQEPMTALQSLTRKYEDIFLNDIARIGNDTSKLSFIRATDTIEEMIQMTQLLLDNGIAYIADDGVYFSIKDYELAGFTYGRLQQIDRSHEMARISNDEYDKDSASDFALWKKAEPGEPSWQAKFTESDKTTSIPGRPGWHIECSAMSKKLLGIPFDVHTGGIDLKFPHHENELAQSCGSSGNAEFSNYFVHNNHILINGNKMSKSLNNFYTLRDIEDKKFSPMAFRLLVLSSHYRKESNFSWDILESAQNRLNNWRSVADLYWQTKPRKESIGIDILKRLQNDLDTPSALAEIDSLLAIIEKEGTEANHDLIKTLLHEIDTYLGINLLGEDITQEQKNMIAERESARLDKDWQKSDELRAKLNAQNVEINDNPNGSTWSRTSQNPNP